MSPCLKASKKLFEHLPLSHTHIIVTLFRRVNKSAFHPADFPVLTPASAAARVNTPGDLCMRAKEITASSFSKKETECGLMTKKGVIQC